MEQSEVEAQLLTGEDCPCEGFWQVRGADLPPIFVPRGHIMPAAGGRVVSWVQTEAATAAGEPDASS